MDDLNAYGVIGVWIGGLCGAVTFLGAWIYCMSEYGFLFGFGLGWLPAGILAAIVGLIVRFLWGPILALIGAAVIYVYNS